MIILIVMSEIGDRGELRSITMQPEKEPTVADSANRERSGKRAKDRRGGSIAVLLACCSSTMAAMEPPDDGEIAPLATELPTELPNSELMLFDEVPTVVSATRQPRAINLTPVPISLITKEFIHYSGLTTLAEVLQFTPGMNVLRMDRNHYAVGVRGFHSRFSDRTLLLIDGRNANNIYTGSVDLMTLPLMMGDIERVEVVRGPGGASWGANAFNGVINIITKDAGSEPGVVVSTSLNEFGDTYSEGAWSESDGAWSWRFSGGYQERETSENAIAGDDFSSDDYGRGSRFRADGLFRVSPQAKLSFGFAHAHVDQGGYGFAEYNPGRDERLDLARLYAKFDHTIDATTSWYVQLYRNFENADRPSFAHYDNLETNADFQFSFQPSEHHKVSIGANARWTYANPSADDPQQFMYAKDDYNEYAAGLFALDQWEATERLTVESQLRGDYYSGTSADWSGRLTGMYGLDSEKRHILRISGAKAFRAPLPGIRDTKTHRLPLASPPLPPGLFGVNLVPTAGVTNEEIYSVEAGYFARFTDHLTLRADAYYHWYDDLVGTVVMNPGSPIPEYTVYNNGGATSPGTEIELAYKAHRGGVSVWYLSLIHI